MRLTKKLVPIVVSIVILLGFYLISTNIPEPTIREIIEDSGAYGVLILIFLIWLTNVIAPLGSTPFLVAGFYSYGQSTVIYATIAAFIASITNFWLARKYGRKFVVKIAGVNNMEKIDNLTKDYGLVTLAIIRVFLAPFHDVISYVFGLTTIKFIPYLIISTLGAIPGAIVWYILSSQIDDILTFTVITFILSYVFLSTYILWIKITKRQKLYSKKNKNFPS